VPSKPRLLVLDRGPSTLADLEPGLSAQFDLVLVHSVANALAELRESPVAGLLVAGSMFPGLRWAGLMLQADEVLDAIADGVAVIDASGQALWANPAFWELVGDNRTATAAESLRAASLSEPGGGSFQLEDASRPGGTVLKFAGPRFIRVSRSPLSGEGPGDAPTVLLTRDVTDEVMQQQKLVAIHQAGEQLADLTPEDLGQLSRDDREDLLRYHILQHMKDILGQNTLEVRVREPGTDRLLPLVTVGMTRQAEGRELFAHAEGNGVTGYVAATGKPYLCEDTTTDPLYLEGAEDTRSSLTVPLLNHGEVIGTLNVESATPNAFRDRDRQFLEIYARSVASALNTLELLDAEQRQAAWRSVEAFNRELALPLDGILNDATSVLDRYGGHDEDILARLHHLLACAREIRTLIPKVGSSLVPGGPGRDDRPPRLAGVRILLVDADEAVRRSAHVLLGQEGAIIETAALGHEALALARQASYSVALVDIRLPDLDGFETFTRLREVQPDLPVILMTGFGYDPSHAIVKARQAGMLTALYKPFRADRLYEVVEQVARPAGSVGS
jgi:CheY-like chemotaxis protein